MPRLALVLGAILLLASMAAPAGAQDGAPVLEDVVIEGNTKTDRDLVLRIIGLERGDPLPLEEFDAVWDRLEDCGYFAFVDLDTDEDDQGRVTLLVTVEEEKTFRATPYLRYDRRHKYLLGAAMTDNNLRGVGEILEVHAIALYIQRAQATWTKPWLFGIDPLELRLAGFWEQAPFVYRGFDYDQWWSTLDLRYNLVGPLFVEFGGGYESFHQRDDYVWDELYVDDGLAGVQTHAADRRDTWLLRGSLGLDTRDNPYYPGHGFYARYGVDQRFGGDIDDQTTQELDLRAFLPLPGPPILALHAYGKLVDSVQYTEHLVRWGGPETVRGARYAGREGDTAYIATAELRWPLFMMPVSVTGEQVGVGLHAFADVGDAFLSDLQDPDPRSLFSFGGGAHVNLLTWQLRFEAAKERDHDWTFQFMDQFNF